LFYFYKLKWNLSLHRKWKLPEPWNKGNKLIGSLQGTMQFKQQDRFLIFLAEKYVIFKASLYVQLTQGLSFAVMV
jgi:hypothetical protein